MKRKIIVLTLLAVLATIVFSGVLFETNIEPRRLNGALSITRVQTMPSELVLYLYNNGTVDINLSEIDINGTKITSGIVYDTWLSNVPVKVPTSVFFNFDWQPGNTYDIAIVYPEGRATSVISI